MTNPLLNYTPKYIVDPVTDLCGHLFSQKCCNRLIHHLDYHDTECMKLLAAKSLGYGIVVGASIVKVPQVLKIFSSKSGAGITVFGVLLELLAITFNACYSLRNNFPFSAWGEAVFLGIETALIAYLVLWYDRRRVSAIGFLAILSAIIYALTHKTLVSRDIMWYLQSSVLPLAVTGKLIQALKNYQAQHTGQISAVTAWSILAGSVVRIFTTIQETGDMLTAVTFACAAAANAIIALQVLFYWQSTQKFLEKSKKKKAQ